jgi:hypothetical protein
MRGIFHGPKGSPSANASDDSFPGDTLSAVFGGGNGNGGPWLSGLNSKFQVQPKPAQCNWQLAQTAHAAINVAMGDGSVRSVGPSVSPTTWYQACTPNGGETLGDDFQ